MVPIGFSLHLPPVLIGLHLYLICRLIVDDIDSRIAKLKIEKLNISGGGGGGGSSNSTADDENSISSNGDISQLEQECVSGSNRKIYNFKIFIIFCFQESRLAEVNDLFAKIDDQRRVSIWAFSLSNI